jgi:hypothetical protein
MSPYWTYINYGKILLYQGGTATEVENQSFSSLAAQESNNAIVQLFIKLVESLEMDLVPLSLCPLYAYKSGGWSFAGRTPGFIKYPKFCPNCGSKMIEDVWEIIEELADDSLLLNLYIPRGCVVIDVVLTKILRRIFMKFNIDSNPSNADWIKGVEHMQMIDEMNKQLYYLYEKYWSNLIEIRDNHQSSDPLLISATPEYVSSEKKLMIIGQQTHGWDVGENIQQLMDGYNNFKVGKNYNHKSSPFWTTQYDLYERLNPTSEKYGFIWNNLLKVDLNKNRPSQLEEELGKEFPVLIEEIRILKPDVVVFFTGPSYDNRIKKTFSNITFENINGFNSKELVRLQHKDLPEKTFRTYHPKYLFLSLKNTGKYDLILDSIIELSK